MSDAPSKPGYRADLDLLCGLPDHIRDHGYFCLWKWELDRRRQAWTKVPYNPSSGRKAKSNDPSTFSTLDEALDAYAGGGYDGVGIGLFDGVSGIDIDHHLDPGGSPDEFCAEIISELDAYTEVSPSGDGVHILFDAQGLVSEFDRETYKDRWLFKNSDAHLETYICGLTNRFLTITGQMIHTGTSGDKSECVRHVLDGHMQRKPRAASKGADNHTAAGVASVSDDDLVSIAKRSRKNGDRFSRLWDGDTSDYGSQSEADQALCNFLAFYTAKDADRMDRMFRQSGLYRDKWEREDYRTATIEKAIQGTRNVYDPNRAKAIGRVNQQSGTHIRVSTQRAIDESIVESGILDMEVNDLNLARAFARSFGHVVRYVSDAEVFYCYDGRRWVPDSKSAVTAARYLKAFYDRLLVCATNAKGGADYDYVEDVLKYASHSKRSNVLNDAKSELISRVADFDLNLDLLNVENGTLDLRTFELRPHDPRDMITKMAGVAFDPAATCEEWDGFLLQSLEGDLDVIAYTQQQMGVTVAGDTAQEHMHMLFGPTRSGKSTCANTIREILGDYACGISPATITKQRRSGQNASEDLARLAGVRMGVIPEPQKGMELSAEVIKMITGNDAITARQLYQGSRDFVPCVNLWVATNHLPQIDDPTVLDSNRIVIVPFPRHLELEERDTGLKARLLRPGSRSGILNWLLDGLRSYRVHRVPVPESAAQETEAFTEQSDRVRVFLGEVPVREDGATCPARALWKLWQEWASAGNADPNKGKQEFFGDLRRLGVLRDRYRGQRNVCVGYRPVADEQLQLV